MASARNVTVGIALLAIFYQVWLKNLVFGIFGVGRTIEPIENFPWTCRRIVHSQLEGCEDLALDEKHRTLYAACSGSAARSRWNPGMGQFNSSGRRREGSELMALYIDEPEKTGFRMHNVRPQGYKGAGDERLDLVGFEMDTSEPKIRFWLINQRPPIDIQSVYMDATSMGANVTVEVFDYDRGDSHMTHINTIHHPEIYSANNLALTGRDSFVLTNDHSSKVGLRREFDMIVGGGNVVHCGPKQTCRSATSNSLKFANGVVRGKDGLIYVAFAAETFVAVYKLDAVGKLEQVDQIRLEMPADNLSIDSNGDIWTAAFPAMLKLIEHVANPFHKKSPATIFRIHRSDKSEYEVTKVIEDRESEFLNGATAAVFDRPSGRLFVGGVAAPFLTVCQPL